MIIHEYTNYYDKDLTNDFKENLLNHLRNDKMNINNFQDIKNLLTYGSESDKKSIKQMTHAMLTNGMINYAGSRKKRNSLFQFVKELGISEKDFYDKYRPTDRNDNDNLKDVIKQTKNIIQSENKEKVHNALKQQFSDVFFNPSKERYQITDKLTIADNKLDAGSRELRKKTVMKEWEQRNQKWKAKHDQEKRRKMLMRGGVGLASAGTAYIAARKLAKLKGLENKYARKLLLLPPNKRSFVQKMLDKIRVLIHKYKH